MEENRELEFKHWYWSELEDLGVPEKKIDNITIGDAGKLLRTLKKYQEDKEVELNKEMHNIVEDFLVKNKYIQKGELVDTDFDAIRIESRY